MKGKDGLLRSVLAILSGRVAYLFIGLLFTPILVRIIGQSEYGVFASVMALYGLINPISRMGLFDSIRKNVAEYPLNSDQQDEVVLGGTVLAFSYGIVVTAITLIIFPYISEQVGSYGSYFLILLSSLVANNVLTAFRSAFYGRNSEATSERVNVLRKFTYAVLGLALAKFGFGLQGVFLGFVASIYVTTLVAGWLIFHQIDLRLKNWMTALQNQGREIAAYGGVQAIGGIAAILLYKVDILLVDYFMTSTDTALYKAALVPAEYIWFIPSAIQAALLHNVASSWAEEKKAEINDGVKSALKYTFLTLTLFSVGLYGLADEFLIVYFGPSYVASTEALQILLIGVFLFGLSRVLVPVLQGTGRIWYTEITTMMALFVNIVLNVVLIPRFGIEGAAIGTGISYTFVFIGNIIIWQSTEFSVMKWQTIARFLLILVSFGFLFGSVVNAYNLNPVLTLSIYPLLGGVLFVVLCLLGGVVTQTELENFYNRFRS